MWQVQSSTEIDQFAMFQNIGSAVKPYRKILQQGACICCKIKEYTSVKHLSQISPLTMPIGCRSPTSTASRSAGGHRSCAVLEERVQSASSVIGTFRVKKVKQIYPPNRPPPTVGQEAVELICQSERKTQEMQKYHSDHCFPQKWI